MLFMQTNAKVYRAVKFSRQLLQYPRVTFVDAIMGRFLLNLMTHMVVFYLLMTGIHYIWDIDVSLDVSAIMTSLAMAAVLGLGFGCMNCFLMWFFPVWESFWIVLTRPLLLMSTVIYTFEDVPWQHQDKLWWNPLIHIIGLMRRGFYPSYEAEYVSVLYVFGLGLVLLAMGMVLLYRWNRILLRRV